MDFVSFKNTLWNIYDILALILHTNGLENTKTGCGLAMTCTLSSRYFGLSDTQTVTYYLNM